MLVRYKVIKCKVKVLNEELTNVYSRIKFLELEVIQANAKVERNLMRCLLIKRPFLIEVVWDTPEKVAQALMCLRK